MDSPQREPARLSALYQYHNAPEVAPAHGLEYDDANYPSSDKYPVIHTAPSYDTKYTGKHAYSASDNRPPRIIFGMKIRTFLLVALIMILIVIGAAVGGTVGGKSVRQGQTQDGMMPGGTAAGSSASPTPQLPAASTPSGGATPATPSVYNPPTPTYSPISDCPQSNFTRYTSSYASGSSGAVPAGAKLDYTKYCDLENPFVGVQLNTQTLSEAFVYSFNDCIEVCAAYNFWAASSNCTVAVYLASGARPGNCWVGKASTTASSLPAKHGTDVAILDSS